MKPVIVKFHSVSDIITNSSSEVYIIEKDDYDIEKLEECIDANHYADGSIYVGTMKEALADDYYRELIEGYEYDINEYGYALNWNYMTGELYKDIFTNPDKYLIIDTERMAKPLEDTLNELHIKYLAQYEA